MRATICLMETNPEEAPRQESAADQGMVALQVVQALATESVNTAMSVITNELLEVVDRCIAVHMAPATTSTASRASSESSRGLVSLPSDGQLPSTASLPSMSVVSIGVQPATISSGNVTPSLSLSFLPFLSSMANEAGLSPTTPLSSLLPLVLPSLSSEAVVVGTPLPSPVPKKLAEKIWCGKFLELSELFKLGVPEQTLHNLVANLKVTS